MCNLSALYASALAIGMAAAWDGYRLFVKPVVMLLDPENAHWLAVHTARMGLVPRDRTPPDSLLATTVLGLRFSNPSWTP